MSEHRSHHSLIHEYRHLHTEDPPSSYWWRRPNDLLRRGTVIWEMAVKRWMGEWNRRWKKRNEGRRWQGIHRQRGSRRWVRGKNWMAESNLLTSSLRFLSRETLNEWILIRVYDWTSKRRKREERRGEERRGRRVEIKIGFHWKRGGGEQEWLNGC
jgi:hypothetical protein